MHHLPTPHQLKMEFSLSSKEEERIASFRQSSRDILQGKGAKRAVILGPCSIHDIEAALEYGERLQKLGQELRYLFLVMRCFIEKPRTRLGWKGLLYDPFLDGSNDLASGLRLSRGLFLELTKRGIPLAVELLEPLAIAYFQDLITWGFIGARTAASQPHRQMVSSLHFPVGFKNDTLGRYDVSIDGILSSKEPHTYLGLDLHGQIVGVETQGNPYSHLVLRGSEESPNYDPSSVALALKSLKKHRLEERLLIDCSHGNSGKNALLQKEVLNSTLCQIEAGQKAIFGVMLESHLQGGRQTLSENPQNLCYGISITDGCLSWQETEELLLEADARLSLKESLVLS